MSLLYKPKEEQTVSVEFEFVEDGKILKGPNYFKPKIKEILEK